MLPAPRWKGTYYAVSRRTRDRRFWLTPSGAFNATFLYIVGRALEKSGTRLVCLFCTSNHWHAIVYDPNGDVSVFMREVNRMVAQCVNAMCNRVGPLWEDEAPTITALADAQSVLDKIAYVMTQGTHHKLVRYRRQWPGARTRLCELGRRVRYRKPKRFFPCGGPEVTWQYFLPPVLGECAVENVRAAVVALEKEAHRRNVRDGATYVGSKRVENTAPNAAPTTPMKRGGRIIAIAASSETLSEEVAKYWLWQRGYRDCLERLRAGEQDVVFPAGAWAVERYLGLAVERSP